MSFTLQKYFYFAKKNIDIAIQVLKLQQVFTVI